MFKIDKYNVSVDIQLENGIYVFDNESGLGKTRLAKLFKKYQAYGEPVASYTYNDKLIGIDISNILKPNKFKVILLDRYDMYEGDGAELILKCAENAIILIDCKNDISVTADDEWCTIHMEKDKIEVVA